MLVDCPTDAATPTDVLFFPSVPERGTADDLTGDRANSGSDRTAKRKEQISPSSRELKDIGDDWPRPTTEFHEACVAAGRSIPAYRTPKDGCMTPAKDVLPLFTRTDAYQKSPAITKKCTDVATP